MNSSECVVDEGQELTGAPENGQGASGPDVWTELRAVKDMVVEQRAELRNAEFRMRATEDVVGEMTRDNKAMEDRLAASEGLVAELKKQIADRPNIAFSATPVLNGTMGPFGSDNTVVFNRVYANVGEAFNSSTGVFTARVRGVYYFAITGFGRGSHHIILSLYKNSQKIVSAFAGPSGEYHSNTSNSVSLPLEVGQQVSVKLRKGAVIYDNDDIVTTFSGHLLFPM